MAIISCTNCGSSMSSEAKSCPKCNYQAIISSRPVHPSSTESLSTFSEPTASIPTVGDWLINFLLLSIPLVNLIVLIVWALDNGDPIRKNFSVAALLWSLIIFFLFILFWGSIIAALV